MIFRKLILAELALVLVTSIAGQNQYKETLKPRVIVTSDGENR